MNVVHKVLATLQSASLRPLLRRWFKQFGYHCATHQIRVILISCVVITSLLYPALALYTSSRPLSTMSSTLLNLFPTDAQSPQLRDLHDLWSGHEALHLRYDATAKARCGLERTVRVERLLIASNQRHENGVLNKPTLRLTLDIEAEINTRLASSTDSLPCVQAKTGGCLYTSPLVFWDFDRRQLDADPDIIQTLNAVENITTPGFPITLSMVVADRASLEDQEHIDIGTFLVLTYYFRDDDCHSQRGHLSWNQLVGGIIEGNGHAEAIAGQPRLLAIQFDAESSRISAISILLYLLYVIVFINFSGSMRRMNTVHSRFGIAFTGMVEIIVSTITSVSVCAIWGFRVTMVPWGILPIIIVFIGAENMFRLVDEVVSTPITLPVKERIARGMSEAGASNTLKVVTCNAALGTIAMFTPGAIRQFCVFALVVLVAHWFLVHTFFVAVLSIDLQRLELHELLRQDRSFDVKERKAPTSPLEAKTKKETVGLMGNFLRGSAARNSSLILMLAITAVLYSVTSSAVPGKGQHPYTLDRVVALRKAGSQSPAWKLWQTLNPSDDPLVHIRSEPPILLFFNRQDAEQRSSMFRERKTSFKAAQRVQQILKVFVLPIATTTTLLWALLVYLLKDTETRDLPENENGHVRRESEPVLEDIFQFSTIPRACIADIDRVDATPDASSIIAVSLENEVVVWSQKSGSFFQLFISDLDQHGSFVTSVAMDSMGLFCAAGTRAGTVALWRLNNGKVAERMLLYHPNKSSRVMDLAFEDRPAQRGYRPSMLHKRSHSGETSTTDGYLLATFKDGSVVEWNDLHDPKPIVVVNGTPNSRIVMLKPRSRDPVSFAVISTSGTVQLFARDVQQWRSLAICDVCGVTDTIQKIHAVVINVDLMPRVVLVASTTAGYVSLWDTASGEKWYAFEEAFEDINRLRLSPIPTIPCVTCGELRPDAFTLTISTGTTAILYRFSIDDLRRCACPFLPPNGHSAALRSRQGSLSVLGQPSRPRLGLRSSSSSNIAHMGDFPVSAHGVHSRRGSEREAPTRRQDGAFFLLDDNGGAKDDANDSNLPELSQSRIAEVSFQEGAWDTTEHIIYGLRRSSDLETVDEDPFDGDPFRNESTEGWTPQFEGLDRSVLERWKLWLFDPTSTDLSIRESTLAALVSHRNNDMSQSQPITNTIQNRNNRPSTTLPSTDTQPSRSYRVASAFPRLPFTEISSLLSLGNSSCLVAFGNTIGLVTFSADFSTCFFRTHHRSRTSSTSAALGTPIPKKRL
ncbi:hypothetical protein FRB91_001227 [Serendipita sp. 411]|nr:hypothetical protein FRB91_001227 [Serendipita sp. 411]